MLSTAIRRNPLCKGFDGHGRIAGLISNVLRQLFEQGAGRVGIEGRIALRAEDARECFGLQLAKDDIAVGDGQRRRRAGSRQAPDRRPRALGGQPAIGHPGRTVSIPHLPRRCGSTSSGRASAPRRLLSRNCARIRPRSGTQSVDVPPISNPISRSKPVFGGRPDHAHNSACRTGKDRVPAMEHVGIRQAAIRLHEHQPIDRSGPKRVAHLSGRISSGIGVR